MGEDHRKKGEMSRVHLLLTYLLCGRVEQVPPLPAEARAPPPLCDTVLLPYLSLTHTQYTYLSILVNMTLYHNVY